MIKYYIRSGNTFVFDSVSENIDRLEHAYLTDCWLIEEDGELTIFNGDGFKQKMQVAKGDAIVGSRVGDNLEYITVKDANFIDLVRRAIQGKKRLRGECEDGQTAD